MKENLDRVTKILNLPRTWKFQEIVSKHLVKSWTTQAADAFAGLNAQTAAAFESMAENIRIKLAINAPPKKMSSQKLLNQKQIFILNVLSF